MISTRDLSELPTIEQLIRLTKSIATLDAIIERDWNSRYYSFNSRWDTNRQMASMRNGEGDAWFCVFGPQGAFLKGFHHECKIAQRLGETGTVWPGMLSELPKEFESFANEPAFSMRETTFCIWRRRTDSRWNNGRITYPEGDDPDGSARLLSILDGKPKTYQDWAEHYYRRPVSLTLIEQIYAQKPLTEGLVKGLNPSCNLPELSEDVAEIDYAVSLN